MRRILLFVVSIVLVIGMLLPIGCASAPKQVLEDQQIRYFDIIAAADGYIYYVPYGIDAIYRATENGNEAEIVIEAPSLESFLTLDGWIYYIRASADGSSITDMYKVRPDGSDNQSFCQGVYSHVFYTGGHSTVAYQDGWIYFIHGNGESSDGWGELSVAKIRPDGSGFTIMLTPFHSGDLILSEGHIYYGDWTEALGENYSYCSSIKKANLNTGDVTTLVPVTLEPSAEENDAAFVFGVFDGWVYYESTYDGSRKMRPDGTEDQPADNYPLYSDGEWLYFNSALSSSRRDNADNGPPMVADELVLYRTHYDDSGREDLYSEEYTGLSQISITSAGIYIVKSDYNTLDVTFEKYSLSGEKESTTVMPGILWQSEEVC